MAPSPNSSAIVQRPVGLTGVLYHDQIVPGCQVDKLPHGRRTAVEVDRYDRSSCRRDGTCHEPGVEVHRAGVDVDENRICSGRFDSSDGCYKRIGRGDNLVTWSHTKCSQGEFDGRETRVDTHGVADTAIPSEVELKLSYG